MATILIAENERAIAQRMAVNLHLVGHSCDLADTAEQAVELDRRNAYDLVLLDLDLPGSGGFEGVSAWENGHPVLLLVSQSRLDACPAELRSRCLAKPFEIMELAKEISGE